MKTREVDRIPVLFLLASLVRLFEAWIPGRGIGSGVYATVRFKLTSGMDDARIPGFDGRYGIRVPRIRERFSYVCGLCGHDFFSSLK